VVWRTRGERIGGFVGLHESVQRGGAERGAQAEEEIAALMKFAHDITHVAEGRLAHARPSRRAPLFNRVLTLRVTPSNRQAS
jgi:hypothetical protein